MNFPTPLTRARFLKREKRFLIHAEMADGTTVIAHTNNTGSMRGLLAVGAEIWLSPANNPARKLKWTLEWVRTVEDLKTGVQGGVLAGVNTILANHLAREALEKDLLACMGAKTEIKPEVKYGNQNSRIDFLLTGAGGSKCWIEVKNVSLVEHGHARFPDSPTERGRKHLLELEAMVQAGDRAVLVFCIQRGDALTVGPADDIDPEYGRLLRKVMASGVEVFGLMCEVGTQDIKPHEIIPVVI